MVKSYCNDQEITSKNITIQCENLINMNSKFKNFLVLLLIAISIFGYSQTPTLIASGTYKANGNGTSGIPSVSINIPAGKNRLMIITAFAERVHSPTLASNYLSTPDGSNDDGNTLPIQVNGIQASYLSSPWTTDVLTSPNTTIFSTQNPVRYVSDAMGLPTGASTITFTGINLPENGGDEIIVNIAVFANVNPNPSLLNWTSVRNFNTTNILTLSATTPIIPAGNTINDIVFFGTGGISQEKQVTFSSGWTTIQSDIVSNTSGSSTNLASMSPNELDGIGYTTAYRTIASGNPTFTLSRTATNPSTEAASANLISILPMARPSVSGTVYIDNNGLTGGINNGGTGGGTWSTANALYVNAIDTNGNVVATALVNTSGVFTFPSGGNLIEGDVIKFQLSKTQGSVGQPAPAKELPVGWGTVGESTTSGTSDGTINGEFTLTIGTANSPNNTTNRFGVTACAAGTVAPEVTTPLSISCPATTINLNIAHTGIVPTGSSLVWFTNSTHTGTVLSGTQITQATAGIYYAFYYDSLNNCYSPAASVAITANTTDSDGDGILDTCDLDDDNDGILDSSECQSSNKITDGVFPTSGATIPSWTTTGLFALNARGLQFDADNVVTTVRQTVSSVFSGSTININNIRWLTTNNAAATGRLITEFLYNGTVYATIDTGIGVAGSIPTVTGNNGAITNISTLPSIASTGTFSTPSNLVITLPQSFASNGEFQIRFTSGSTNADDISIESVQLISCSDFDGDGIPNYLDLDSDRDGCSDAVEGSGNFNPSTTASGTLTTQAPNINFGTAVDANGIPTIVGASGQGIGDSLDVIKDCKDSDGDGIPDWQDLDDDNDGILDCVENGLNTTLDKIFKANNNATLIASPSTGPVNQYRLTNGLAQNGQVWSYGKVDFTKSFTLSTKALLSGADGIAIVFHNSPLAQSASGTNGQGLGARGIANGIALELDTFANSCVNDANNGANCDPSFDHGSIRTTATWINAGKLAGDGQLGDGTVDDGLWHDVVINWNSVTRNLSYTFDGVPVTNYTFPTTGANAIETILAGNSAYFGFTASTGGAGNNNSVGFDSLCTLPIYLDTDSDGISNHLDLDSDGDSCTDAIEGAGNFTTSQLTTASGNISSQSPNQNFGIAVDANGIPVTVGAVGQEMGQSQDISKNDCLDSDNDGVPNWIDLDSDNDGILDIDENCTGFVAQNTNGIWKGDTNSNLTVNLGTSTTQTTNSTFNDGKHYYYINNSGAGNRYVVTGNFNNFTYTFSTPVKAKEIAFYLTDLDPGGSLSSSVSFKVNGGNPNGKFTSLIMYGLSGTAPYLNFNPVTGVMTHDGTDNQRILLKGQGDSLVSSITINSTNINSGDSVAFSLFALKTCDTDQDGISNDLDLDSDGDGCPDAIEGSANFTSANLFNSSMSGGNTGGSYIGIAGPVSNNLGNTVGNTPTTMGVPTIAGTGQAVGGSQIATNNSQCLDSDGDGVPDYLDLDDDNDGILDTVEMCKSALSTDFFNGQSATVNAVSGITVVPTTATLTPAVSRYSLGWHFGDATGAVNKEMSINFNNPVYLADDGIDYDLGGMDNGSKFGNFFIVYEDGTRLSNLNISLAGISPAGGIIISTINGANAIETQAVPNSSANLTLIGVDRTKRIVKMGYTVYALNGNGATSESMRPRVQIDCDMDGDGIPNQLDLDSDNDGCLDAIEGGANITTSQLINAGGIITVGTGSTATNQNLCGGSSCVDANGVPNIVGASGQTVGDSQNGTVSSQCSSACYKPGITNAGNTYPTKHGITALGRSGAENENWPMVRQSAWTVLEAKTKGLVINRVNFNASNQPVADDGTTLVITNPVEGMMVYDITNNCLKIYTSNDGGSTFQWHCMSTQTCPQ
jgi:hypothetical protein